MTRFYRLLAAALAAWVAGPLGAMSASGPPVLIGPGGVAGYSDPRLTGAVQPTVATRAPTATDDASLGYAVGNLWGLPDGRWWQALRVTAGQATWAPVQSSGLPCDQAPAVGVCYGTRRLRAAYTGPALVITRTSDSTTQTVGFLSNGALDTATGDAFCTGLTPQQCPVTTLYDQGPSGYNATGTTAGSFMWDPTCMVAGTRCLRGASLNNTFGAYGTQIARFMTVPTFAWTQNPSTWTLVSQQKTAQMNSGLIGLTNGNGYNSNFTSNTNIGIGFGGSLRSSVPMETTPTVVTLAGANSLTVNSNNASGTAGGSNATAQTGAIIGNNTVGQGATMDLLAVRGDASTLTATQTAAIRLSAHALFGIFPQANDIVVFDGDSTAITGSILNNTPPRLAVALLNRPVRAFNCNIHGQTLAAVVSRLPYVLGGTYLSTARNYVYYILAGANDVRGGATAAAIYANLQAAVAAAQAKGPNVRVVVATEFVQTDIAANASQLAALVSYNQMIRAGVGVPQSSGGLGNVALVDMWADPTIGPSSSTTSSAMGNATIANTDGQHLTDTGMAYYAGIIAAGISGAMQ